LRSSRTGGGGGGDEEGSQAGGGPAAGGNAEEAVIWGTNVNVTDAMERFRDFVLEFGKTNEATVAAQVKRHGYLSEVCFPACLFCRKQLISLTFESSFSCIPLI
jgi:hypothetical protein